MSLIRLYARVLDSLGSEARLGWILAVANVLLAVAQFAEPVLFGWISSFSILRFCAAYSSARLSIAAGSILALRILSPPPWPVSARKPPLRRFCAATERDGGLFLCPKCSCQNRTARRVNTLPAAPAEPKDFTGAAG
jgi:hypothetical protein